MIRCIIYFKAPWLELVISPKKWTDQYYPNVFFSKLISYIRTNFKLQLHLNKIYNNTLKTLAIAASYYSALRSLDVLGRHFLFKHWTNILSAPFHSSLMNFKMKCHTGMKLSTYLQHPLFESWGETPNYFKTKLL